MRASDNVSAGDAVKARVAYVSWVAEGCGRIVWAVASLALAGAAVWHWAVRVRAADTLEWALVQAYQNNPSLNAQRAALRATDENVPQALVGLSAEAQRYRHLAATITSTRTSAVPPQPAVLTSTTYSAAVLLAHRRRDRDADALQRLPDREPHPPGGKPGRWARARRLRVTEQQVLLDAATAYMNLLRDGAILDLNRRNVEVLTEQLKQTRDRFNVGEVTRTDVAQAESRLAAGRSQLLGAQSNYMTSQANYRRVIGVDPGQARARHAGRPAFAARTLPKAIAQGQAQSPSVLAATYGVDVAAACGQGQRRRALSEPALDGERVSRTTIRRSTTSTSRRTRLGGRAS